MRNFLLSIRKRRKSYIFVYLLICLTSCFVILYYISLQPQFSSVKLVPNAIFSDNFDTYQQAEGIEHSLKWSVLSQYKGLYTGTSYQWYISNNTLYKQGYLLGDYTDEVNTNIDDIIIAKGTQVRDGAIAMIINRDNNNGAFGIVFSYSNQSNYFKAYVYLVNADKTIHCSIYQRKNDKDILLADTMLDSDVQLHTWINLSLITKNNTISFYRNNNLMLSIHNNTYQKGKVGIYAWPQTAGYFNNFSVSSYD